MKNLKKFRIKNKVEKIPCDICQKELVKLSSIKIQTYDASHFYKGSKRPFIMNYKIKVCPNCFKKLMRGYNDLIFKMSK